MSIADYLDAEKPRDHAGKEDMQHAPDSTQEKRVDSDSTTNRSAESD
jgi:hypothetical protein